MGVIKIGNKEYQMCGNPDRCIGFTICRVPCYYRYITSGFKFRVVWEAVRGFLEAKRHFTKKDIFDKVKVRTYFKGKSYKSFCAWFLHQSFLLRVVAIHNDLDWELFNERGT